jgi:hypothetical protein
MVALFLCPHYTVDRKGCNHGEDSEKEKCHGRIAEGQPKRVFSLVKVTRIFLPRDQKRHGRR